MRKLGRNKQSGFTLVEIAIVLVIIGLLLGGVLKGTELIENSKVKRAVSEINGISAAYYSYVDRFQRIPGDDGGTNVNVLRARGGSWSTITKFGNNDGILTANRNATWNPIGTEHEAFWQHIRAAGFVTGDATAVSVTALPRNAFGGLVGLTTQPVNVGLQGTKVCLSQVPGKAARAIDTQIDDGVGGSGRTRATQGGTNPSNTNPNNAAGATYSDDNYYTVCTQI